MEFKQYQHVERLGTDEVDGLTLGTCFVFPKIDGTNASIWRKEDGTLGFGSRKRELSHDADNAGFMAAMVDHTMGKIKGNEVCTVCAFLGVAAIIVIMSPFVIASAMGWWKIWQDLIF